jgi:type I restriction enzyme S subunit
VTSAPLVRIGEVAEQVRGVSYGKGDASDSPDEGRLPVLRAGNITDAGIVFDDLVYVPQDKVSKKQLLRGGDVLIAASSGSLDVVGKAAPVLADYEGAFGAFCKVLRPNTGRVDARYFSHFFGTPDYRRIVSGLAAGANINNLRNEHLDDLLIPLPPIPEQRRIAAILDKAEALRTKRREALAQLDRLAQSIFLEMFGDPVANPNRWPRPALAEASTRIQIGPFGSQLHEEDYVEGGIPLLNPTHFRQGKIEPDWSLTVPEEKYRDLAQYHLAEGDLILGRRGEMGRCAVISAKEHGWLCGTGSLFVRPNKAVILPAYLSAAISARSMRSHLENVAQGVTMPNLNKDIVGALPIALPPLELQGRYSSRIKAVEKLAEQQEAAQLLEHQLFSSLQHSAFQGAL